MKTSFKTVAALLSLCLLLPLSACAKEEEEPPIQQSTATQIPSSLLSADDYGVVSHGYILEEELPEHTALQQWYAQAQERENLVYAVFYGKNEADGLWYCWLYTNGQDLSDSLRIQVDAQSTPTICLSARTTENDRAGAFCFALPAQQEPAFSLSINGEQESLLLTLTGDPALPPKP